MKTRTWLTLAWGLVLLAVSERPAAAFCDPQAGRWLNRDQIEEEGGPNAHAFARQNPINRIDALGQFSTADHNKLTADAYGKASVPIISTVGMICDATILAYLQSANVWQDFNVNAFKDLRRHYNREYESPENASQKHARRWIAHIEFRDYLHKEEDEEFVAPLKASFPKVSDCKRALNALGRMSHSWQDFYGHGIHAGTGWTTTGPMLAAPNDFVPLDFYPSTYASDPVVAALGVAEHPLGEPPFTAVESQLRKGAAVKYTAWEFGMHLNYWLYKCKCHCNKL